MSVFFLVLNVFWLFDHHDRQEVIILYHFPGAKHPDFRQRAIQQSEFHPNALKRHSARSAVLNGRSAMETSPVKKRCGRLEIEALNMLDMLGTKENEDFNQHHEQLLTFDIQVWDKLPCTAYTYIMFRHFRHQKILLFQGVTKNNACTSIAHWISDFETKFAKTWKPVN